MILWLVVWGAWVAGSELLRIYLGMPAPSPWISKYALPVIALRAIGIVILAPFVEELIFRGLLYRFVLAKTPLGAAGAILLPSILFALLHVQYGAPDMAFVFADGAFKGFARYRTSSLNVPIAMHATGNLFALIQRLGYFV